MTARAAVAAQRAAERAACARRLRAAAEFVVTACEDGFIQCGMDGPDPAKMGRIWFDAYMRLKAALTPAPGKRR